VVAVRQAGKAGERLEKLVINAAKYSGASAVTNDR
jgi:hypothetical protein